MYAERLTCKKRKQKWRISTRQTFLDISVSSSASNLQSKQKKLMNQRQLSGVSQCNSRNNRRRTTNYGVMGTRYPASAHDKRRVTRSAY